MLYCGGRFYFDYQEEGYINKASEDYRAILLGDVSKLLYPQEMYAIKDNVEYLGPFYFECENQSANDVVAVEKRMLEKCTDAIFILDKADCAGTIAELVYASSLQKRIHVYYVRLLDDEETESELHTPNWYPIILSMQMNPYTQITACANRNDAEQKSIAMVRSL